MSTFTVKKQVKFAVERKGQKKLEVGIAVQKPAVERLPRITRMMALAIRFVKLIRDRVVVDQSELARLGKVTRARLTQIMNLLFLAPVIQDQLLHLSFFSSKQFAITEKRVRAISMIPDWNQQLEVWAIVSGSHVIKGM